MAAESDIEWTDATWNPTRGCTKISPGCKNCYAEAWAKLLAWVASDKARRAANETTPTTRETDARLVIANRTHAYVDLTGYRVLVTRDRVRSAPSSVQQKSAKKAGAR